MRIGFYPKLAASNIRKNRKTYIPYVFTCILTIAMFYIVKSLSLNPGIDEMAGGDTISYTMLLGSWVVALFAFLFLYYTHSFLIKRRKKEFGVFNILGMEKRHLAAVLSWETVYVFLLSLTAGIGLGIALDKMMFLLIGKLLGVDVVLGFFISSKTILMTVELFAAIFVLILLNSVLQIHISNPIELLQAGSAGEKEPKTKWLMALLGLACTAAGYAIAITVQDPVASVMLFFVAVLLVIAGTYMLFTAGSIAFLKMLRRNKKYYYKTRHFTSVSGMIYRMKQNAAGLANICILSTMVLVMVSATCSMVIGLEDILNMRYPTDFSVVSSDLDASRRDEMTEMVKQLQTKENLQVKDETSYAYLTFSAYRDHDTFHVGRNENITLIDSLNELFFMLLSDYNTINGENRTLDKDEVLITSLRTSYDEPVLNLFDKKYRIAGKADDFAGNGTIAAAMLDAHIIVVPDMDVMQELYEQQKAAYGDRGSDIRWLYGFNSGSGSEQQKAFYEKLSKMLKEQKFGAYAESKEEASMSFKSLYGGFFFIGMFLSVLFVMATVLIIYYKQISEGYDDKARFEIMQKVGMELREVKASIRSQVLMVFFLPLAVAGIHVTAAFPLISRIMALLNFVNVRLHIICTAGVFLIFGGMYVVIYIMTARVYYRIVSRKDS